MALTASSTDIYGPGLLPLDSITWQAGDSEGSSVLVVNSEWRSGGSNLLVGVP